MSDILTQQRRKAQAFDGAVAALRDAKPDTPYLDETLGEPFIPDEDKLTAIVAELTDLVTRQGRAIDHTADHLAADLTKRVEKLEKGSEPQGKAKSRKK